MKQLIGNFLRYWFGSKEDLDSEDEPCLCGLEEKLLFRKENTFIAPDRDGYNDGMWKKFNGSGIRIGTWDRDLTKLIGK